MITVSLYKKLRNEVQFVSKDALAEQIALDKADAADFFRCGGLR